MGNVSNEAHIDGNPHAISKAEMMKIIDQMNRSICKINYQNSSGTGFFCKIQVSEENQNENYFLGLITCNHVLDKTIKGKTIKLIINEITYPLIIKEERQIFSDKMKDITIIPIKEGELPNLNFLFLDENIFDKNPENIYKDIYILHFEFGKEEKYSTGVIEDFDKTLINNTKIFYSCSTQPGSSGGPIINLKNYKVIGLHKGFDNNKGLNRGLLIGGAIKNFKKWYKAKLSNNKENNNYNAKNDDNNLNKESEEAYYNNIQNIPQNNFNYNHNNFNNNMNNININNIHNNNFNNNNHNIFNNNNFNNNMNNNYNFPNNNFNNNMNNNYNFLNNNFNNNMNNNNHNISNYNFNNNMNNNYHNHNISNNNFFNNMNNNNNNGNINDINNYINNNNYGNNNNNMYNNFGNQNNNIFFNINSIDNVNENMNNINIINNKINYNNHNNINNNIKNYNDNNISNNLNNNNGILNNNINIDINNNFNQIKEFHEHPLFLSNQNDKICNICLQKINEINGNLSYKCNFCSIIICQKCIKSIFNGKINIAFHPHTLKLKYNYQQWNCIKCGFIYGSDKCVSLYCEQCNLNFCDICYLSQHDEKEQNNNKANNDNSSHEHNLIIVNLNDNCYFCGCRIGNKSGYKCENGDLILCDSCYEKIYIDIQQKNNSLHEHDLKPTVRKEWYCDICKKYYEKKLSYFCKICNFDVCYNCYYKKDKEKKEEEKEDKGNKVEDVLKKYINGAAEVYKTIDDFVNDGANDCANQ